MSVPVRHELNDRAAISSLIGQLLAEAARHGFSVDRCGDLRTAVSEACLNALEHASGGTPSTNVLIDWNGSTVTVVVESSGPPFEIPAAKPDLYRKLEGLESPRGWGLFLIRSLADDVRVTRRHGRNELLMTFTTRTAQRSVDHG